MAGCSCKAWLRRSSGPNVLAIIGVVYQGPDRVRALTVYGMVMGAAAEPN